MVCCDVHKSVPKICLSSKNGTKNFQNMQRLSETKPAYLFGSKFGANIASGFGQTHLDCWDARGTQRVRPGPRKRSSCWSTAEHTAGYTSAGASKGWPAALWQGKVALSVKKRDVGQLILIGKLRVTVWYFFSFWKNGGFIAYVPTTFFWVGLVWSRIFIPKFACWSPDVKEHEAWLNTSSISRTYLAVICQRRQFPAKSCAKTEPLSKPKVWR